MLTFFIRIFAKYFHLACFNINCSLMYFHIIGKNYMIIVNTFIALIGDLFCNKVNVLICQQFQAFFNDTILNQFLADDFLITTLFPYFLTYIIMIFCAVFSRSAVTNHHILAMTAKEFCSQQVFAFATSTRRCPFILF